MNAVKHEKMDDMDLNIYNTRTISLNGVIRDGQLHITSEVYGDDYDSEKHYVFSVEDTNKLFSLIDVDSFIELCRKENVIGMEAFFRKNEIHPNTFCI